MSAIAETIVVDGEPIGSIIAEFSVTGGGYIFTMTANPSGYVAFDGAQLSISKLYAVLLTSVTIHADNGAGSSFDTILPIDFISLPDLWIPGQVPFAINSQANLPVPDGMPLQELPWPATGTAYRTNAQRFSFDVPDASAPLVTIDDESPGNWGNPPLSPNPIPMTPGFTGSGDFDNIALIIYNNLCTTIYNFSRTSDTTAIAAGAGGYGQANVRRLGNDGFGYPNFDGPNNVHVAGPVAVGMSGLLGAMLKQEYTQNVDIKHCLSMAIDQNFVGPGFWPPAINSDGNKEGTSFVLEGMFLAIPKTTSMPAGLSPFGAQTFRAMQNYGVVINDSSTGTTDLLGAFANAPTSPYFATSWQGADLAGLTTDAQILIPLLYSVGYQFDGLVGISFFFSSVGPQKILRNYLNALLQITRDSDSHALNVATDGGPSGLLNQSSITSFCAGTVGRVQSYFDQTALQHSAGTADWNSAGANAPIIYQSGAFKTIGASSQPAMLFDGSTNYFASTKPYNPTFANQNLYFNAIIQIPDYANHYALLGGDVSGAIELRVEKTTGFLHLMKNDGTSIAIATMAVPLNLPVFVEVQFWSATSYFIMMNGITVASGSTAVTATFNYHILVGNGGPTSADLFKGLMGAWTILGNGFGGQPQVVIQKSIGAFWGPLATLTLVNDTFTDSNGTLLSAHVMDVGGGWTDLRGSHWIQGNKAQPNTLVSGQAADTVSIGVVDGKLSTTITPAFSSSANAWRQAIGFRWTNDSNGFLLYCDPRSNVMFILQVVAGFAQTIATVSHTFVSGTPIDIEIVLKGSSIKINVDGTQVMAVTSTANSAATLAILISDKFGTPPGPCSVDPFKFTNQ